MRLRPRNDGTQWVKQFQWTIAPTPAKVTELIDIVGNACLCVWFEDVPTDALQIETELAVETYRDNPFDYFIEPWALTAPIDYPSSMASQLAPYLQPGGAIALHPEVIAYAHQILHTVAGNVSLFLTELTRRLNQDLTYLHRPVGAPYPASVTLAKKAGSCRDFAVLFMAVCQAVGLAARFVSGYQEGDLEAGNHELHAWPEVFVPGGGWRGFDPTLGLAVADRHIALAAALTPVDAAPVSGLLKTREVIKSTLTYDVRLSEWQP